MVKKEGFGGETSYLVFVVVMVLVRPELGVNERREKQDDVLGGSLDGWVDG